MSNNNTLVEEAIEKKRFKFPILSVGRGDVSKENTLHGMVNASSPRKIITNLDDTSSAPHTSNTSII
jgi:hypothetical protein